MSTGEAPDIDAFIERVRAELARLPPRVMPPKLRNNRLYMRFDDVLAHRQKRGGDPARALAWLAAEAIRQGAAEPIREGGAD